MDDIGVNAGSKLMDIIYKRRKNTMYLYESHMGGIFTTDEILDWEDTYCEQCGDSDSLIGEYSSIEDFWDLLECECDINGSGGWSLQYIYPNIVAEFEDKFAEISVYMSDLKLDDYDWCELGQDEILDSINAAIAAETIDNGDN